MSADVFGHVRLAHVVVESSRVSDWRRFLHDAVGAHVDELDTGRLAFRMDEHRCRFLVTDGPSEDVTALGWQVDDEDVLEAVHDRLRRQGIVVTEAPGEQAALRGVERMLTCIGPKGLAFELYVDAKPADGPLVMSTSGFVTGDLGMGHVALTSKHADSLIGFAHRSLGARVSDYIDAQINGLDLEITFLRVNARHHSMAVARTRKVSLDPIRTRVQHINVEVATFEDLTEAYVRCRQLGFRIALGVGMHTNDRDVSFYAVTPSGFEVEVGWNPITVDDEEAWQPMRHQGISIWGHKPLDMTLADKLGQAVTGVRSLGQREDQVPALSGLAW